MKIYAFVCSIIIIIVSVVDTHILLSLLFLFLFKSLFNLISF